MGIAENAPSIHTVNPDVINLFGMSIGLAYFIYLIVVDAWSSIFRKPCTVWISGKALILTALTIQILTYLDYKNISLSDKPEETEYNKLLGNQMVIDSGRLVICVFIGYLLPGMARPGSASQWGDILALVISLFSAVTSELYYVYKNNNLNKFVFYSDLPKKRHAKVWFMVSSMVVLFLTVMLILLLVSAILAAKTVRGMLSKRMRSVIEKSSHTEPSGKPEEKCEDYFEHFEEYLKSSDDDLKKLEDYLIKFEDEIMRSWILCRVGKPQYVIARSVLSSSVALLVTFAIVLLVVKGRYFKSDDTILRRHDGWDWLRLTTFGLQCAFILLGWIIILWRYFTSVFYIPKSFTSGRRGKTRVKGCLRCVVEDFWTRSISELIDMYDLHEWRLRLLPRTDKKCGALMVGFATKLKFHKLLYIIWHLQNLLVLFSKCCWFMSWLVLRCKCIQKFLLAMDRLSLYSRYQDETRLYQEFLKHKEALQHMCMPGEHPAGLWLADERAYRQAQERFGDGIRKRWDYLNVLLTGHFHQRTIVPDLQQLEVIREYFPTLNENCWKITAVSLLRIISAVSSLNPESHLQLEAAIKACRQAWDLMTFAAVKQPISINVVQVFDYELDQVSISADTEFKKLIAGKCLYKDKLKKGHQHSPFQIIHKLLKEAERELREQGLLDDPVQEDEQVPVPLDSIDWNEIAPAYSLYRVCKLILNDQVSEGGDRANIVVNNLCGLLVGVIGDCVLKLPGTIVKNLREWAVEYEDESIWDAIYIGGQTRQVLKLLFEAKYMYNRRPSPSREPQLALPPTSGDRTR